MIKALYTTITCFLLSIVALAQSSEVEKVKATVDKEDIENHIYYLASDELRGRETGTPGIEKAADYIAERFKEYGVQPVPGAEEGYFQTVWFEKLHSQPKSMEAELSNKAFSEKQLALLQGSNATFKTKAIFLNYGTNEDFEGNDVQGRVVIVKGGWPEDDDTGLCLNMLSKRGR